MYSTGNSRLGIEGFHKLSSELPVFKAALRYLKQELQLGRPLGLQLTSEGQLLHFERKQGRRWGRRILPKEVRFDNCNCRVHIDNSQRLQLTIVRFFCQPHLIFHDANLSFAQEPPNGGGTWFTSNLSLPDMEAVNDALQSNGIIPDGYQIDKKACLLPIYSLLVGRYYDYPMRSPLDRISLISPTRHYRGVRLNFNPEYRFTWHSWSISSRGPDVEVSHVTIDDISWTW